MQLQDTPFMKFMVNSWIKYERFKGMSRICAIFLNFFILIFKLIFCGVGLLIMAPHIAANHLLSKYHMTILQKMLYVILVIISLVVDLPIMIILMICVAGCVSLIPDIFTNIFIIIPVALFIGLSRVLCKILIVLVSALFSRTPNNTIEEDVEQEDDEEEYDTDNSTDEDDYDELSFCQLFTIGTEMCLLISHIEMCPDETAFIRVVDDEGYTPLYKRKVRRDKAGNRFIVFNSTNYYLDDKKTQPIITKK